MNLMVELEVENVETAKTLSAGLKQFEKFLRSHGDKENADMVRLANAGLLDSAQVMPKGKAAKAKK